MQNFIISALLILALYEVNSAPTDGDLFLTPLIKSGELDKAKALAEDSTKAIGKNVKSYSGYFTIDEKLNSNLFFWFFPAQQNPEKAPVILWINEMPGFSSLKGIFLETGPFILDENNMIQERNATWTRTHSVLYLDSPVGTGFSFTDAKDGYAKNSQEDSNEVYEALKQFFTLFKEYQPNDFYLAGENYAASFIPYIADHIVKSNQNSDVVINIKGFIIGSPFIDIYQNTLRGKYVYDLGLVDEEQRKTMEETMQKGVDLIGEGKIAEGSALGLSTIVGQSSMFSKFSGFNWCRNALRADDFIGDDRLQKFIDDKEIHRYLHVGLHKYSDANFEVFTHFAKEIVGFHGGVLQKMLDNGMRVLLYAPQFDVFITADSINGAIKKLKWKGAESFAMAERKIWRVNGDVAGYTKSTENFSYALVRNSGNFAIRDQPEWMLDLVEKFLQNKELV